MTKFSTSFWSHIHCHVTVLSPHSAFGLDHVTWLGQWYVTQEESRKSTKAPLLILPCANFCLYFRLPPSVWAAPLGNFLLCGKPGAQGFALLLS